MIPSAILMDRDGVVNVDVGYTCRPDDISWIPGFLEIARELKRKSIPLYLITNQSAVARGLFSEAEAHALMAWMCETIDFYGGNVSGYYLCPHHPKGTVPRYAIDCSCRKPKPGLIDSCIADNGLERGSIVMIGDKDTDMLAALGAGIAGRQFKGGNLAEFLEDLLRESE